MPVNTELMKTMTTRMICQLTPMAAFAGVADEMPDHRVVDDALQPGDDVLQHRRPRQPPDGGTDGAFDDRAIELSLLSACSHANAQCTTTISDW